MAKVSRHSVAQVIADKSLGGVDLKRLSKSVAAYLLEERRVSELESLLRDVQKHWADKGYVDLIAKTARPLDGQVLEDLAVPFKEAYPQAKEVAVTEVIDKKVIGGARVEIGEQRFDLSIARRLNRFKKSINAQQGS